MQTTTPDGLRPAKPAEKRYAVKCIHNAPPAFEMALEEMVATKTPGEMKEILAKPDVVVTNFKDKEGNPGSHTLQNLKVISCTSGIM